ncbi:MAG: hypothetical protein DIAAKJNI_00463 [Candidatus Argoarchaeum ethanivorans]|uniref:DUF2111 domain-containing protein n=1 Tax=Candidatus Argoarchaeum ethanivorans TaxID=2608793 RepID=A0A811TEU5_9EURY|nr:MAG: hypothetical protein DIAAKJNI_00463 [Candidatus Argoarchaeum ethanivorans]
MPGLKISKDSSAKELEPIAMAVHQLIGLPVAMRSVNKKGIHIINGKVMDDEFTGTVLEQVLSEGRAVKTIPSVGLYQGVPVDVVPVFDCSGELIAAIGIVTDVIINQLGKKIDLPDLFRSYPDIAREVRGCLDKYFK